MKYSIFVLLFLATGIMGFSTDTIDETKNVQFKQQTEVSQSLSNETKEEVKVPKGITSKQQNTLKLAYNIAKKDGHSNPKILQAIVYQESKGDSSVSHKDAKATCFGPAQIKVAVAKEVMKFYPELYTQFKISTNNINEIKHKLIFDEHFNLTIASKYVKMLKDIYGFNGLSAIRAYNRGPGAAKRLSTSSVHLDPYVKGVLLNLKMFL